MKIITLCVCLALAGCANTTTDFHGDGNIVSLPEWGCSYTRNNHSAGFVFIECSSKYNTIRIKGVSSGLVVSNYIAGSPADLANFPLAVSIVKVNGIDITTGDQFISLLHSLSNKNIEVEYIGARESGKKILNIVKGEAYIKNCQFQYKYKNDEYLKRA